MTSLDLQGRCREMIATDLPLPGGGATAERHLWLMEVGREDLSLARMIEAHYDAVAILAEAGHKVVPGALYGVWASEKPGEAVGVEESAEGLRLYGAKPFCTGAGLIDRALVTAKVPVPRLVEVNLAAHTDHIRFNNSAWKTPAFAATGTAAVEFMNVPVARTDFVGPAGWYLERPGFSHGALGPAACWAGGAEGLYDYALAHRREDAHTLAHVGAMHATVWGMKAALQAAGEEIDRSVHRKGEGQARALTVRHLIEQGCTEVLRRFARAFGPHPLAFDEGISRRYAELDLYVRQSHGERDLEALGALLRGRVGTADQGWLVEKVPPTA